MKLSSLTNQITIRRTKDGFTLIELLVVVSIIALLAAGSVGAYGKVMNVVKKNASQKTCVELAGAIASFVADYDKFPISNAAGGADHHIEDTAGDGEWLGILSGKGDPRYNSRKTNFIDGFKQAKFIGGRWVDGINYEGSETAPTLIDPWGLGYRVVMDTDFNGEIDNPELSGTGAVNPVQKVRGKKVLIWGPGLDGDYNTWQDNPKSW
jgi:prepilin-type N-terminal cleavage/methylation domain-containing protein